MPRALVALPAGGERRLTTAYAGVFSATTVRSVLYASCEALAAAATVTKHLPLLAERFAAERLDALAHTANADREPRVLFVCAANSGRSQIAAALFNRHADGAARAWSAGTAPGPEVEAAVVASLAEIGIDAGQAFPKAITDEVVAAADVVISLGCLDALPPIAGRRYADRPVADPGGGLAETVRTIRDEIDTRVTALLTDLRTTTATPHSWPSGSTPVPKGPRHVRQALRAVRLRPQRRPLPDGRRLPRTPGPRRHRGPLRRFDPR
ncbi:low molecular weight phosphatase family protein [Embleya sp. NPDC127516]|uniref:arsenate-mycothiol transferase ArsC n=1 Tax=Embleya sp. NPDC127516 TaxID=3363990 RepID=UPI0038181EF5